jgi:hypothetical protein
LIVLSGAFRDFGNQGALVPFTMDELHFQDGNGFWLRSFDGSLRESGRVSESFEISDGLYNVEGHGDEGLTVENRVPLKPDTPTPYAPDVLYHRTGWSAKSSALSDCAEG